MGSRFFLWCVLYKYFRTVCNILVTKGATLRDSSCRTDKPFLELRLKLPNVRFLGETVRLCKAGFQLLMPLLVMHAGNVGD